MEEDALFLAWDILVLGSLATFFRVVLPILNPPRNLPLVTQFFLFLVNISSISCLFKKKKKKLPLILLQSLLVLRVWDPLNSPIIVYTPRDKEPCGFPFVEQYEADHTGWVLCNGAADCS